MSSGAKLIDLVPVFAIVLKRKKAGCFASIVLQTYCYYKCSVALPPGAVGWSAVCDCGIS